MPWQNWSCPGSRGRNRGSTPGLLELRTFVTKNRCEPVGLGVRSHTRSLCWESPAQSEECCRRFVLDGDDAVLLE
jgi:hypothetical protein